MSLVDHALSYAARGWPVFPLRPGRKEPAITSPHPKGFKCRGECGQQGHGFHDATTDADQIRRWWARWPNANIGAPTGIAFDVLDIDHQDYLKGVADLPDCETEGGPVARSGGGKWHIYVLPTGLGRYKRFAGVCDWLGTDGYVVLPPSVLEGGGTYSWFASVDLPLTAAPAELVEAVRKSAKRDREPRTPPPPPPSRPGRGRWNPAGIIGRVATAPEGQRNDTLTWGAWRIGCDVHEGKVDQAIAVRALDDLHRVATAIGLTDREVEATIRSGFGAGIAGIRGRAA